MNDQSHSPLTEWLRRDAGHVLMTGAQALVRLPMLQSARDRAAGLNTAGYVSGYRGSPLGGLDSLFARTKRALDASNVTFAPGLNEELAATAIWGTQQIDALGAAKVDGVFGMWYGKGPGVERAADALRHGNFAGAHKNGGVLVVYGDDHPGKSSTTAHQSEQTLAALSIPSLYPADVQDFVRFGLLGWAMSRFTGSWVGFKCVNETVEQTATVDLDFADLAVVSPELGADDLPPDGLNIRPMVFNPQNLENVVTRYRLPLVQRFVRANRIDRPAFGAKAPRLGLVAAGKAYHDAIHALGILGVTQELAEKLGIGVYKLGCIWPLEPEGLREFSAAAEALFFIEEKRAFVEAQARELFYNDERRPHIYGKMLANGEKLLPSDEQLAPADVARAITLVMRATGIDASLLPTRNDPVPAVAPKPGQTPPMSLVRMPYFCSGCPHSRSTQLPSGSIGFAGIGCHGMAVLRTTRDTLPPTQMGGEGANWIGMHRYAARDHVFQNLGDGTFMHSGILAIRAAVASGANITFKVLYNDAVAMTGGQPHDGPISAEGIAARVVAEGVGRTIIVSEIPERFEGLSVPAGVSVRPRTELTAIQEEFRAIPGVTAIIYDQTCAAEKRRRRKKGSYPDPAKRMFIFDEVCEGCGDCSTISTCVSIEPKDTPLGTKRRINQSSCNKDYSCAEGFCPSFVTVLNAEPVAAPLPDLGAMESALPAPTRRVGALSTMVAGIGGTGVITVAAILARAAHSEGLAVSAYDMTGLAQKNGAVFSHLKIADQPEALGAQRVGAGEADLMLAFDLLAAIQPEAAGTIRNGHTMLVGNADVAPTAFFQMDRTDAGRPIPGAARARLTQAAGPEQAFFVDATRVAEQLCGDTIAVNLMLVGFAAQKGLLPVSVASIVDAIVLNGAAVELNKRAFLIGRVLAHEPDKVLSMLRADRAAAPADLDAIVADRMPRLTAWGSRGWAKRYKQFVDKTRAKAGDGAFTRAVATNLAKLMTYKDEYEVARLYSSPVFKQRLAEAFGPASDIRFNLAPPMWSSRDPRTGHLVKKEYGKGVMTAFGVLARLRKLRGTWLDPFGRSAERQMERDLIGEYQAIVEEAIAHASGEKAETALALAQLPEMVKGYGHVKEANVEKYRARLAELRTALAAPAIPRQAAE
ncbi:MAG: indolepyruvate ferredoxin oxidoreductase family protein [Hyphomicrobiales bacterium]|nr:indolepyruvate ferredoxin oxidoreductase family protein [Hyphomicrobiales bacterium]